MVSTTAEGLEAETGSSPTLKRLHQMLTSRASFLVLLVVLAVALGVGSVHPGPPTTQQRIERLEGIIKCPSCDDESIAQSNAATAVGLRTEVEQMVRAGRSDAAIEHYAVNKYGEGEILVPSGGLSTFEWAFPLVALVVAAAALALGLVRRSRSGTGPASADDEALVESARRGNLGES